MMSIGHAEGTPHKLILLQHSITIPKQDVSALTRMTGGRTTAAVHSPHSSVRSPHTQYLAQIVNMQLEQGLGAPPLPPQLHNRRLLCGLKSFFLWSNLHIFVSRHSTGELAQDQATAGTLPGGWPSVAHCPVAAVGGACMQRPGACA
eukprot:1137807-Pelagomonas_calceolata.AAC.5